MIFHWHPSRSLFTRSNCINIMPSRSKYARTDCRRDLSLAAQSFVNHTNQLHQRDAESFEILKNDCRRDPSLAAKSFDVLNKRLHTHYACSFKIHKNRLPPRPFTGCQVVRRPQESTATFIFHWLPSHSKTTGNDGIPMTLSRSKCKRINCRRDHSRSPSISIYTASSYLHRK